jgi:hypothetical protein
MFNGTWLSVLADQRIKRLDDLGSCVVPQFPRTWKEGAKKTPRAGLVAQCLQVSASGVEVDREIEGAPAQESRRLCTT